MSARRLALVAIVVLIASGRLMGQDTGAAAPAADPADQPEPGSQLAVSLLTIGPGDAVWELFGHNALRIRDRMTGSDDVVHWGLFSFRQANFLARFLRGEMTYSMGYQTFAEAMAEHRARNRSVWEQELNLSPADRVALVLAIRKNLRDPGYRYEYFLRNCSTRIRNLLDAVVDGRLQSASRGSPGHTYRFHARRLTEPRPAIWAGIDLLLGPRADAPITGWEGAFVPMVLRDQMRLVELAGADGNAVPLVASETQLNEADRRPEAAAPRGFVWPIPALGLALGSLLALAGRLAGRGVLAGRLGLAALGGLWGLVAGGLGIVLVLMHFTGHVWAYWNENILQLTPLSALLAFLVPVAALRGRPAPWTTRIAFVVLVVSAAGFAAQILPGVDQQNGELAGFALAMHAGLWVGLRSFSLAAAVLR